jgi:hypothetical protein
MTVKRVTLIRNRDNGAESLRIPAFTGMAGADGGRGDSGREL